MLSAKLWRKPYKNKGKLKHDSCTTRSPVQCADMLCVSMMIFMLFEKKKTLLCTFLVISILNVYNILAITNRRRYHGVAVVWWSVAPALVTCCSLWSPLNSDQSWGGRRLCYCGAGNDFNYHLIRFLCKNNTCIDNTTKNTSNELYNCLNADILNF